MSQASPNGKRSVSRQLVWWLPNTKVGSFTQEMFDEARRDGWIVISMKDDWKTIFAPAKVSP